MVGHLVTEDDERLLSEEAVEPSRKTWEITAIAPNGAKCAYSVDASLIKSDVVLIEGFARILQALFELAKARGETL